MTQRCTKDTHVTFKGGEEFGWADFGKTQDLQAFIVDDSLAIELQVTAWAAGSQERVWLMPAAPASMDRAAGAGGGGGSQGSVGRDLAAFLAGGQAVDVDVGGGEAGGWAVKAHRVVLAARSPVFNSMLLESGMRECGAGARIPLEGFDQAVVEQFVRFLYADELGPDFQEEPDALCHLLALGHRYEVASLVRYCTTRLQLTDDTAIERLIMAEQLGVPALKERAMDYICSCRARLAKVQKTEAFARMCKNCPGLMAELFAKVTEPAEKRARVSEGPASCGRC